MKKSLYFIAFCFHVSAILSQSSNENYIKKTEFNNSSITVPSNLILSSPVSNTNYVASQSILLKPGFRATGESSFKISPNQIQNNQFITYYDGLGKPKQQISVGYSPDNKDIVQHIEYDEFGRITKEFLPHQYTGGNLGDFRLDAQLSTKNYYKNLYAIDFSGVLDVNLINAYSEKQFENSPLNRVLKQSLPGESFKMGSGHEQKFEYKTNEINEVKIYTIDSDGNLSGGTNYYPVGRLTKSIVKTEDWKSSDGTNYTTQEFKDHLGRVILTRYFNDDEIFNTYYVYDNLNNLRYVLPPKINTSNLFQEVYSQGNPTIIVNQNILDNLAYQYKYDDWNRLVEKKIPNKPWECIVYDTNDRPILTQDGTLKEDNLWAFVKYDAYGRTIYSGLYFSSKSRSELQIEADNYISSNNPNNSENRTPTTNTIGQVSLNYNNTAFPTSNITEVLAINYYDDYNFTDSDKPLKPTSILSQNITTRTNGLITASWVKTLNQNSWTKTYTFYDEKARPIREYSKNYLGGATTVDSKLNFSGITLKTIATHKKLTTDNPVTIINNFEYDHASRLKKQTQQVNSNPEETIVMNTYNGIGMLIKKEVGGRSNPLQKIDYTYNVRGELTKINDINNDLSSSVDNDLFAYKLNYEGPVEGTADVPELYNGTITQSIWRNFITDEKQSYSYVFDKINRVSSAFYRKGGALSNDAGKFDMSGITYDKGGNIKTLLRNGVTGQIDNLSYSYSESGNQLKNVEDVSNNQKGYRDTSTTGDNYTYDENGRLIADSNKSISNIEYNHLDLPKKITFTNGNYVETVYDASGNKLEKLYVTSAGTTKTIYIDGFQYQDNQLQFFGNAEGYTYKDGNGFKNAYIYTDHLGNNRLSYSDVDGNGTITTNEVFSKTDYYPFGLTHEGEFISNVGSNYKYKYQGKELQEENNLQQYDFGSRLYDASVGRWFVIDPQAESFYGMSPYMAMNNNPVMMVDPDGEFAILAATIAFGGLVNGTINYANGGNFWKGFAVGAAAAGVGIGVGSAISNTVGNYGFWAGAATGAGAGFAGGFTSGFGNSAINGGSFSESLTGGLKSGATSGLIGGAIGGITGGVKANDNGLNFWDGVNPSKKTIAFMKSSGFAPGDPVAATDANLIKAQKAWIPDAPMKHVGKFTVENVPEFMQDLMDVNGAYAATPALRQKGTGLYTGRSNMYFNKNLAFSSAKRLFYTMAHEFNHVSQHALLKGFSYSAYSGKLFSDLKEFHAYNYQSRVGDKFQGNSFPKEMLKAFMNKYPIMYKSFNPINFKWTKTLRYKTISF